MLVSIIKLALNNLKDKMSVRYANSVWLVHIAKVTSPKYSLLLYVFGFIRSSYVPKRMYYGIVNNTT